MKKIINDLSVYISGNNESKTILFVHGFPFDHTMWQIQIDEFSKDYNCVSYDIRGLGESPAGDGQFTMESFVDDLETILDELKLNRPILCGLSMGGYISLRAVERIQEKFSAAILQSNESIDKLVAYTNAFMSKGGSHIQYNMVDTNELRDAKVHPENHRDLIVRIGGFSAYFTQLSPDIQDDVINRNEHTL